jgi:serine/threonine protein phosphatase 1
VIGDIHGQFNHLKKLVEKIYLQPEDEIIFTGDYTDRGPMSYEVYQYLKQLKEERKDKCTFLLGNHEEFVCEYVYKNDSSLWMYNGGQATIESFRDNGGKEVLFEYAKFLKDNTQLYYECDDFYVVHAGLTNEFPDIINKNDMLWDRMMFKYGLYQGKFAFVGHTPVQSPCMIEDNSRLNVYPYHKTFPIPKTGLLSVDTGCFSTGNLTAVVTENKEMTFVKVQSNFRQQGIQECRTLCNF